MPDYWIGANLSLYITLRLFVFSFQISSSRRLSFDSSNRRSNGLAAEAGGDTNASASVTAGNGTANSSKYFGSSKLSSLARSLANRKGKPWANGNVDEGDASSHFPVIW